MVCGHWISRFSGMRSVQVSYSDEAHLVYRVSGQICNERLERLLRKALGRQVTGCLWRSAAHVDDPRGPIRLGLEALESGADVLVRHAMPLQVVRDEVIPGPSRREQSRSVTRETMIVDEPGALHHLQRLASNAGSRPLVGEPSPE